MERKLPYASMTVQNPPERVRDASYGTYAPKPMLPAPGGKPQAPSTPFVVRPTK